MFDFEMPATHVPRVAERIAKGFAAALAAAAVLGGCTVGPSYRRPEIALPPHFENAPAIVDSPATDVAWWDGFHDPQLTVAVQTALAQNLDLLEATARLAEARAAAAYAGAALLPAGALQGSASRTENSLESPIGEVVHAVGAPRRYADYSVGVQASWEIDLFGSLRRAREAAAFDAQAAGAEVAAVRVAIAAETADAYLALREQQAELALAESQEQTQTHLAELVRQRTGEGVSSERELARTMGELERLRAAIDPIHAAMDGERYRLDVLMGAPAASHFALLEAPGPLPAPPLPLGGAAPRDLLRRRPDIVIAERRLAAANARIGIALAEYYPKFSLSGLLGVDSVSGGSLLTRGASEGTGIAGLRWRLFDFGRIEADVAAARARDAAALAAYRGSVLRATADVESALSRFVASRHEAAVLVREVAARRQARDQAETAYEGGVLPLIEVLDADRDLLAASDRLIHAEASEARASVAAYRALGGGWSG